MNTKEREVLTGKLSILLFAVAMVLAMISVPAYAEENDVVSISYDRGEAYTLIDHTDGFYTRDADDRTYFRYYCSPPLFLSGSKLTVTYKDGVSTVYTCTQDGDIYDVVFENEAGDRLDRQYFDTADHQATHHWEKGEDNSFTLSYMGVECQIPVHIVENPIASIHFDRGRDFTLIEHLNGSYVDDDSDPYFEYDYPDPFIIGSKLTITDRDGVSTEYTCVEGEVKHIYESESGDRLDNSYLEAFNNQREHHWKKGGENHLTIAYMGAECQLPVYIIDNPIASISYDRGEDLNLVEYKDGYYAPDDEDLGFMGDYFRYSYRDLFIPGAKLTVTGKDGVSTEYTCLSYDVEEEEGVFESESGERLESFFLSTSDDQLAKHWKKGRNYITITYMGVD